MYAKDRTTIIDRRELLRVKLKSLAAESKIIRKEELRTWGPIREELYKHRTHDVRLEARATHIAYGLLRGKTRDEIEPRRYVGRPQYLIDQMEKYLMARVDAMIKKYGPKVQLKKVA